MRARSRGRRSQGGAHARAPAFTGAPASRAAPAPPLRRGRPSSHAPRERGRRSWVVPGFAAGTDGSGPRSWWWPLAGGTGAGGGGGGGVDASFRLRCRQPGVSSHPPARPPAEGWARPGTPRGAFVGTREGVARGRWAALGGTRCQGAGGADLSAKNFRDVVRWFCLGCSEKGRDGKELPRPCLAGCRRRVRQLVA